MVAKCLATKSLNLCVRSNSRIFVSHLKNEKKLTILLLTQNQTLRCNKEEKNGGGSTCSIFFCVYVNDVVKSHIEWKLRDIWRCGLHCGHVKLRISSLSLSVYFFLCFVIFSHDKATLSHAYVHNFCMDNEARVTINTFFFFFSCFYCNKTDRFFWRMLSVC